MDRSIPCPKCKRVALVLFDPNSGQKLINCSCGNIEPAVGLNFTSKPEHLFKYRPYDNYAESWILNEELFFASPGSFNDPFDSKVMYTMEGTLAQKKKYLSEGIEITHPGIRKKKKWDLINRALENAFVEREYDGHIARIQQRIDQYGVVSFSKKQDDLLMFSYYAKDHTGYCLKYLRSAENVLSMAREIVYEPSYPKFSVFDFSLRDAGALGDKVLLTKASCWQHEAEWRISFANYADRVMKSPHPILVGIILGCNMKAEHRKEIVSLNKRRTRPVEVLEARKKKCEFALEIAPLSL